MCWMVLSWVPGSPQGLGGLRRPEQGWWSTSLLPRPSKLPQGSRAPGPFLRPLPILALFLCRGFACVPTGASPELASPAATPWPGRGRAAWGPPWRAVKNCFSVDVARSASAALAARSYCEATLSSLSN